MGHRIIQRIARIPDGRLLNGIFLAVLGAAIVMLVADYRDFATRQDTVVSGFPADGEPAPMRRPVENDQVRPYLPHIGPPAQDDSEPTQRPLSPAASGQERMTFSLLGDGHVLAYGTIEQGTADELRRALAGWGSRATTLVLHSPGGYVQDALEMAQILRTRGMATQVRDDAYCASSCPLVFAGGIDRIAGPKAWIGVHQIYTTQTASGSVQDGMSHAQMLSARAQAVLDGFGVDPRLWIFAMQTPKEKLYFFTSRELQTYKLATRIAD